MLGGFGIAGFGADRAAEAIDTLKRLQGDGYTRQDGAARTEELAAWAHLFAVGMSAMDAAERGAFVRSANELLTEWESLTGAPTDGDDTVETRQERVAAFFQLLGRPADYELVWSKMGVSVTLDPNTYRTEVTDESATPGAVYVTSLLAPSLPTADVERIVRWVLRAAFPVWAWGGIDRSDPVENLVHGDTARWNGSETVGSARLGDAETLDQERPRSRFRDWCHFSSVKGRDLNEIQWRTLLGASVGVTQGTPAGRSFWFTCSITNSSSKDITLAAGQDFRRCLARITLRHSTTDVRPGQAGDTGFNAATQFSTLWYTGTGGASYTWTPTAGIDVLCSAADGHLILTNGTGSTQYVTIWVELSGPTNVGTSGVKPTYATLSDPPATQTFAAATVDAFFYSTMRSALAQRAADGAGADAWSGFPTSQYGGMVRVVSLGASTRPGSNASTYYADRSADWRDRLLSVVAIGVNDSHGALGAPADAQTTVGHALLWTGSGITLGQASLQSYAVALGQFRLAADSSTGALVIEHHTGSSWAQLACTLIVHATDQLGKRSSATPLAMPAAAVDASPITASQLNFLQDMAMASQGLGCDGDEPWRFGVGPSWARLSPEILSFGEELRGWSDTRLPARRERDFADGRVRSVYAVDGALTPVRRDAPQPAFGRVRRVLAQSVANATTLTVDSTEDWKDRMVVAWIAVSSSDLRPGQASDTTIAANAYQVALYSGEGAREVQLGATSVYVLVQAGVGGLQIRNASGGTRYVTGWVEASFKTGCR